MLDESMQPYIKVKYFCNQTDKVFYMDDSEYNNKKLSFYSKSLVRNANFLKT